MTPFTSIKYVGGGLIYVGCEDELAVIQGAGFTSEGYAEYLNAKRKAKVVDWQAAKAYP